MECFYVDTMQRDSWREMVGAVESGRSKAVDNKIEKGIIFDSLNLVYVT